MSEIHEKVSTWAKLRKCWEKMESDRRSSKASTLAQVGTGMCAMEVELRALRAKAEIAPNTPSEALKAGRLSASRPSA